MLKFDFDYLVRSNVSTILDYRLLDYYLKKHDINYGGPEILMSWRHVKKYGFESIGFKFATGGCIILSKNMAQLLINNQKDIDYDFIDDVTIGLFFKKHYICVEKLKGNYISVYNSKCSYPYAIYYRNKRENRTEDITYMKNIVDQLLKRTKCDIDNHGIRKKEITFFTYKNILLCIIFFVLIIVVCTYHFKNNHIM